MSAFNWVEGTSNVKEIVKALATDITLASNGNWILSYPANTSSIDTKAIISTTTSNGLSAFALLERPEGALNHILISLGDKLNDSGDGLDPDSSCVPARFAWYRLCDDVQLFEWTAIQYWLSFNADFINLVLQGDPSLDIAPYNNFLISYAYIGALESFDGADADDKYNIGLSVSSDLFPFDNLPDKFGKRTATCITDIGMLGTRTGTPFQAHLPKFSTAWEFSDKNFITSSQWTHKYHMSDIIIYHAYDRERGKLQNVLIGDRSAIFHLDILVMDKGKPEEKEYVMFNINAPFSFLNNSPNVLYGIALRKK